LSRRDDGQPATAAAHPLDRGHKKLTKIISHTHFLLLSLNSNPTPPLGTKKVVEKIVTDHEPYVRYSPVLLYTPSVSFYLSLDSAKLHYPAINKKKRRE
jgi:hypothetical protein